MPDVEQLKRALAGTTPQSRIVCDDQDTADIIAQLVRKHKECTEAYDRIYIYFAEGDIYEICERLWVFCKKNFNYVVESKEKQYTSSPGRMLQHGDVDCKNYSLFCAGVLDALKRHGWKLEWRFRFAGYKFWPPLAVGHVFVVVNERTDNIWLDPVFETFNQDNFYWWHSDKKVRTGWGGGVGAIGAAPGAAARIAGSGAAENTLLSNLLEYQQGLIQAIQISQQTSTLNTITTGVLQAVAGVTGIGEILGVLKLAQVPLNNAFGQGSTVALLYSDLTSLNIVGMFNQIFNGRTYNSDQYWGTVFYKFFVLGQNITNQDQVSDSDVMPAMKWFIDRTGLFISGRQHIMRLIEGTSSYLAMAQVNTDTTTDSTMVAAAVLVAQKYWVIDGQPSDTYASFPANLMGAWKNTIGVFDTGLAQIAAQYNVTPETIAAQTGDQYATQEVQAAAAAATPQTSLLPGVPDTALWVAALGILAIALI